MVHNPLLLFVLPRFCVSFAAGQLLYYITGQGLLQPVHISFCLYRADLFLFLFFMLGFIVAYSRFLRFHGEKSKTGATVYSPGHWIYR